VNDHVYQTHLLLNQETASGLHRYASKAAIRTAIRIRL